MPFRIVVYKMQRIKAHKVRKMPVRFGKILRFIEHYDAAVVYRYIVEFCEYSLVFFRIFAVFIANFTNFSRLFLYKMSEF